MKSTRHDSQDNKPKKALNSRHLFAIVPLIPHIVVIIIVLASYNYIFNHGLFPEWINYIYYAAKVLIALEIFAASAQTLLAPILTLITGLAIVYFVGIYNLVIVTASDGWQLVVAALVGFLITLVTKF